MQNLAFFVLPDFKNHRVQPVAHPADGQELLRNVGSLIEPIWPREQFTRLFKAYATPGILPEPPLYRRSKLKRI
jgi:hypothetical protein